MSASFAELHDWLKQVGSLHKVDLLAARAA